MRQARIDQVGFEFAPAAPRIQQVGQRGGTAAIGQFQTLHALARRGSLKLFVRSAALCGRRQCMPQLVKFSGGFAAQLLPFQHGGVVVRLRPLLFAAPARGAAQRHTHRQSPCHAADVGRLALGFDRSIDRESLFYFNLLDIPPKPKDAAGRNLLQFAVRTRVKLFHRPEGLQGAARDAAAALQWSADGDALQVRNPSAYHVTLSTLTLADGRKLDVDMIAPGTEVRLPLPQGTTMPATVSFQWLDDYGTPRNHDAPVGP